MTQCVQDTSCGVAEIRYVEPPESDGEKIAVGTTSLALAFLELIEAFDATLDNVTCAISGRVSVAVSRWVHKQIGG